MITILATPKIKYSENETILGLRPIDAEGDTVWYSWKYSEPTHRFRVVSKDYAGFHSILIPRESFDENGVSFTIAPTEEVETMMFANEIRAKFGADEMKLVETNGGFHLDLFCYNEQEKEHLQFLNSNA